MSNGIHFLLLDVLLFSSSTVIPMMVVVLYVLWRGHIIPLFLESMYRVSIVSPELILVAFIANYVSLVFFHDLRRLQLHPLPPKQPFISQVQR